MDPDKKNPPEIDTYVTARADMHEEGIDIVGTSTALDNEFSSPESAPEIIPQNSVEKPQETEIVPQPIYTSPITAVVSAPIKNDPSIKPLRTFKSDAEEVVRYGGVSKIDIAVAEQKKREANTQIEYNTEQKHSAGLYVGIVVVIVLLLSGGWYYWFSSTQEQDGSAPAVTVNVKTLLSYTKGSVIVINSDADGEDALTLISARLASGTAGIGNVFALIPVASTAATSQAPIAQVLVGTRVPNRLVRSLGEDYMIGKYSYDVESPFFIIKNTFYQNAFSGMLDWEKDLGTDLLPFIRLSYPDSTLSSLSLAGFEDAVISNINVRALKNNSGTTVLAYAFADKDTIIITTSENGLKYILGRLLQVRTIQ